MLQKFIILLSLVIFSSCKNDKEAPEKKYEDALNLTIEKNLKFRNFSNLCDGFLDTYVKSDVFVLPVNKELIDAVVEFKAFKEQLSDVQKDILLRRNYRNFLESGKIVFIQMIINNNLRPDEFVVLNNFSSNITLQIENRVLINLCDFTPSLAAKLNPGFNAGYLYFNGTMPDSVNSYSVNFSNITLHCSSEDENTFDWAFAFDRSELNFFGLLEKGMNSDEIRKKYVIASFKDSAIDEEDVIQIIKFLFKTFSKI